MDAPSGFAEALPPLPAGATLKKRGGAEADVIVISDLQARCTDEGERGTHQPPLLERLTLGCGMQPEQAFRELIPKRR